MEDKIVQEALELVRHAMSLVDLKLYDDAIQILRQATRLYEQTNLETETNALRKKIAEIYTLKEVVLNEENLESTIEHTPLEEIPAKINDKVIQSEVNIEKKMEEESQNKDIENISKQLIKDGNILVEQNRFEEALDKYDEAINTLKKNNKISEIDNIYKLIENCYVAKANFIRKSKEEHVGVEVKIDLEKLGQTNKEIKEEKIPKEEEFQIETERIKAIEDKFKREFKDQELQQKVTAMIDEAEKMAREYESKKLKSLKDGQFEEICIYPEVIVKYSEINKLLKDRGWVEQAKNIESTINIYKEKLEQDIKLREIEVMKAKKEEEFEESMKAEKFTRIKESGIERLKSIEEKLKKEHEDEKFQIFITETVDNAEKLVRTYELEIKKGNFDVEPPYQKVIDIYTEIRQSLIEKQWLDQVDIYTNQIRIYELKLEQDQKLRVVEAQKREKEKLFQESLKIQKPKIIDEKKIKEIEEKYKIELEDAKFQNDITSLVEEADKMERDYDSKKKKAIKDKNLLELETPYPKILEIYEKIKDKLLKKGWTDQAKIYTNQIQVYTEKYERDKILRDIEAHKLQK